MGDFNAYSALLKKDPPRINRVGPICLISEYGTVNAQENRLSNKKGPQIFVYGKVKDWWADFIDSCYEHSERCTSGKVLGGYNQVAVHPFFEEIERSWHPKRDQIRNLVCRLKAGHGSRILFDSPFHYGLRSHELVSEGLIDRVIFTAYNDGIPLTDSDLDIFAGTYNALGGVYGEACVETVAKLLEKRKVSFIKLMDATVHATIEGLLADLSDSD